MRITESSSIENDIRDCQEVCSDYELCGLKKHGLTRLDYIYSMLYEFIFEILCYDNTLYVECIFDSYFQLLDK